MAATPLIPPCTAIARSAGAGARIAAQFPLLGIGRHDTCGHLLMPGRDRQGTAVYHCRTCPHRPAVPADQAHRSTVHAITNHAPRLDRRRPTQWFSRVVATVRLDDHGRVVALRWRTGSVRG